MAIRKPLCLLLYIFGVFMLVTACHTYAPDSTEPIHSDPAVPDTSVTEALPLTAEDLIITVMDETISWTDSAGNDNIVHIRIPKVVSDGGFVSDYNYEILSYGNEILAEVEDSAEGAYSPHIVSVDYEAWLNDDMLSILVTTKTCTDYVEYRADNFSLADGKAYDTAAMCSKFLNLDYPVFLKYTSDKIMQDFETEHADFISRFPEDYVFVRDLYLSDLSFIKYYQLYLNQAGTLMLICDRPAIAGAGYYAEICKMSVDSAILPAEQDAWNWLFDLYLCADQDNIELARDILLASYEENKEHFLNALQLRTENQRETLESAIRVKNDAKG